MFTRSSERKLLHSDVQYHVNAEAGKEIPMWRRAMRVPPQPRQQDPSVGMSETLLNFYKGLTIMRLCCVEHQSSKDENVDEIVADSPPLAADTFFSLNTIHAVNRSVDPVEEDSSKPVECKHATDQSGYHEANSSLSLSMDESVVSEALLSRDQSLVSDALLQRESVDLMVADPNTRHVANCSGDPVREDCYKPDECLYAFDQSGCHEGSSSQLSSTDESVGSSPLLSSTDESVEVTVADLNSRHVANRSGDPVEDEGSLTV